MRRRLLSSIASVIAFASIITSLAGCGGNNGNPHISAGPFAKTFTGEIDDRSGGLQSIKITIAPDGKVTGSSIGFTVDGTFNRDGHAILNTQGGTLTGTFNAPTGTTTSAKMFNSLTKKTVYVILLVSPTLTNYGYMGYQRDTTKNSLFPLEFTVDSTGQVSGTVLVDINNVLGFANVTGTLNSNGDINLRETQNGKSVNKLTGTLIQSGLGFGGNITFGDNDQGTISTQIITG